MERATSSTEPAVGGNVLAVLKKNLNPQLFETWFSKVQVELSSDTGQLEVRVPNNFYRDWIQDHYAEDLRRAAFSALGTKPAIVITVLPAVAAVAGQKNGVAQPNGKGTGGGALAAPKKEPFVSEHSDVQLNPVNTFANFVVGPNNQLAHAAAKAVVEHPGRAYNPLFLHGSVGLGKTHLLQAICHALLAQEKKIHILYLSCETFVNHFISSVGKGDIDKFRFRYRHVDLLLIDDVQALEDKARTQEEFFHTFNTLQNVGKQIVLSSDRPPRDIPSLPERLVSRFASGLVVEIDPPGFETRVAIVQKKSRLIGVELPLDVASYVAERVTTNIRELEGAVVKVIGFANLMHRVLDLSVARDAFRDGVREAPTVVNIERIIDEVCEVYSVKKSDLQSKRRLKSFSLPRQICMYLARRNTRLSLEEIGGFFGGRDHTTVLYATERIEKLTLEDTRLAATVQAIGSRLRKPR